METQRKAGFPPIRPDFIILTFFVGAYTRMILA